MLGHPQAGQMSRFRRGRGRDSGRLAGASGVDAGSAHEVWSSFGCGAGQGEFGQGEEGQGGDGEARQPPRVWVAPDDLGGQGQGRSGDEDGHRVGDRAVVALAAADLRFRRRWG